MINRLLSIFRKKTPGFHPNHGQPVKVKKAFRCDGIQFYELDNILDIPEGRRALYEQITREFDMRVDSDYLIKYCEGIEKLINKGDLSKIAILNAELKARTEMLIERDTMYRLMAIHYFTMSDDLSDGNYDLVTERAQLFKKKGSKWLLSTPFRDFLPRAIQSSEDLNTYLKAAQVELMSNLALITNWSNRTASTEQKK